MDGDKRFQDQSQQLMTQYLSDPQKAAIEKLESAGWVLSFIRRPLFEDIIPFVKDAKSGRYGILELDGTLNEDHELITRY